MKRIMRFSERFSQWAHHSGKIALTKHAAFVTSRQKTVFAITTGILLLSLVGMTRLTVHNNYEADLSPTHPIVRMYNAVKAIFGNEAKTSIGIFAEDGDLLTAERLGIVRTIEEEARRLPGSLRVTGLGVTPTIFGKWVTIEGEQEWAIVTEPLLARIPKTPEEMDTFKTRVANDKNFSSLVAPDFTFINVLVETENDYAIQRPLNEALIAMAREHSHGGIRIVKTGDLVLNYETDLGIERQFQIFTGVSITVILLALYAAFRAGVTSVIFPLLLVATGNCWTLGVIGWTGRPLNVVTHAIPVLLVIIAVSYVIRVLTAVEYAALDATKTQRDVVKEAIETSSGDIVKTAITAAFGSITLLNFPVAAIREFGIFLGVGIFVMMILAIGPLAAALAARKKRQTSNAPAVNAIGDRLIPIGRFAIRRPKTVLAITVIILVLSGMGITRLQVGVSWREFFPRKHEVPLTADLMNEKLGYSYSMIMVVDTGVEEGVTDPAMLKGTMHLLAALKERRPDIGATRAVTDVIVHVNRVFHEDDPAYAVIPDDRSANAELLLASSLATSPGDFSGLVDHERRRMKATLFLNSHDIENVRQIYELAQVLGVQFLPPQARLSFGGPAMLWVAQTQCVVQGKVQNIALSIPTVAIFGICIFGIFFGVLSVVPLSTSIWITFGIMGWLGIRLNMATSIVTSMAVGFGVDSAFHFLHFFTDPKLKGQSLEARMEYALRRSGKAIVVDTAANAAGFLVFLLSDFSPVFNLGWLVALTLVLSLVGIVLVLAIVALLEQLREIKRPTSK